jgi:hypothetical protein
MADGGPERPARDVPTGPTEAQQQTDPNASDLPAREDGQSSGERSPGRAEEILPALGVDWRLDKGSDPDSPLAGLLAAAAASAGSLDARAYREFLETRDGGWPTVEELESHYGSFGAALEAAGINVPDRGIA